MSEIQPLYYDRTLEALHESGEDDMIQTRDTAVNPYSDSVSGPVSDQVLVSVDPGDRLRLRKFHLHADPALGDGVYPVVTLKLGSTTVFVDKFEAGLPYAEGIPIEGGDGDDLTLSVTESATVYVNVRYEIF